MAGARPAVLEVCCQRAVARQRALHLTRGAQPLPGQEGPPLDVAVPLVLGGSHGDERRPHVAGVGHPVAADRQLSVQL